MRQRKDIFKSRVRASLLNKLSADFLIEVIRDAPTFNILDEVVHCENFSEKVFEYVKKTYLIEDNDSHDFFNAETLADIMKVSPIFYERYLQFLTRNKNES